MGTGKQYLDAMTRISLFRCRNCGKKSFHHGQNLGYCECLDKNLSKTLVPKGCAFTYAEVQL